ncbi:MAG: hypothetical protein AABX13_03525 [Nanoarchaeota archaeon]
MKPLPPRPLLVLALSSLAQTGCPEAVIRIAYATGAMKTHEEMCCQELVENKCIRESYEQCKSSFPMYGGSSARGLDGKLFGLPQVQEECVQPHIIDGYCAPFTRSFTGRPHPRDTPAKPAYLK